MSDSWYDSRIPTRTPIKRNDPRIVNDRFRCDYCNKKFHGSRAQDSYHTGAIICPSCSADEDYDMVDDAQGDFNHAYWH